jgi:mannose-6-phosphate isomerase
VGAPHVLVCIEGNGQVEHGGATFDAGKGDVFLLPAVLGPCTFQPRGAVNVLEIEIPE